MQPHIIELERVDGLSIQGIEISVNAAANVRIDPAPAEGWHNSDVRMSIDTARRLHGFLSQALARIAARQPPR
jgi:hypothetical protein